VTSQTKRVERSLSHTKLSAFVPQDQEQVDRPSEDDERQDFKIGKRSGEPFRDACRSEGVFLQSKSDFIPSTKFSGNKSVGLIV
jgi:hypothetical protein